MGMVKKSERARLNMEMAAARIAELEDRIRELEASIAALKNDRLTWAMACECACDACEVLSSRIAHLPTVDRKGEHE